MSTLESSSSTQFDVRGQHYQNLKGRRGCPVRC